MPKLTLNEKKRLIAEAYEAQKTAYKYAQGEEKAKIEKKRKQVAVYATGYNVGRMSAKTFCNVINKYHPSISISYEETFQIEYK